MTAQISIELGQRALSYGVVQEALSQHKLKINILIIFNIMYVYELWNFRTILQFVVSGFRTFVLKENRVRSIFSCDYFKGRNDAYFPSSKCSERLDV